MAKSSPLVLGGDESLPATRLVTAFRKLSSPQLLVLGAPGSGKSTLAMLFVLALLADAGPEDAVPVLMTFSGWDPEHETLTSWLARRIGEDYPELTNVEIYGHNAISELLHRSMVLPVLDGLDEMPPATIPKALDALNQLTGTGGPAMVVTCRREEYLQAIQIVGPLAVTATVTIKRITVEDAIRFLTSGSPADGKRWRPVAARMRANQDGVLSTALSTPLMTALARLVYRSPKARPADLCDLKTTEEVQQQLLGKFLATVYTKDEDVERTTPWLRWIAEYLEHGLKTWDLKWWELTWAVPSAFIVVATVVLSVVAGAAGGAIAEPFDAPLRINAGFGLVLGIGVGAVAGLGAVRGRIPSPTGRGGRAVAVDVLAAAARDGMAALLAIVALVIIARPSSLSHGGTLLVVVAQAMLAGVAGSTLGLITGGLRAVRGAKPTHPSLQLRRLAPQLASGFGTGLVGGLPVGVIVGLIAGLNRFEFKAGIWAGLLTCATASAAIGVPVGVGRWLSQPSQDIGAVTPRSVLTGDRTASLVIALFSSVCAGLLFVTLYEVPGFIEFFSMNAPDAVLGTNVDLLQSGLWAGCVVFWVVLIGSGSPWISFLFARIWLVSRGRLPGRLIAFLEDAHRRDILRQIGAVYQFRHAQIQEHLAGTALAKGSRLSIRFRRPSVTPTRRERLQSLAATILAMAVLSGTAAVAIVPGLREVVTNQIKLQHHKDANRLIAAADRIQESAPDDALRLRVAAVELDPESTYDLSMFLWLHDLHTKLDWHRITWNAAAAGSRVAIVDDDGIALVWDLRSTTEPQELGRNVARVELSPDAGYAIVHHTDGTVTLVNFASSSGWPTHAFGDDLVAVTFSSDDRWMLAVHRNRTATLWDTRATPAHSIALGSNVGSYSLTDHFVSVNLADGAAAWELTDSPHRTSVFGVNLDSLTFTAQWAIAHRTDGSNAVFDTSATASTPTELGPGQVVVYSGGSLLKVYPQKGDATLWALSSSPAQLAFPNDTYSLDFSADRRWAIASQGNAAELWDMAADPPRPSTAFGAELRDARFVGNRNWMLTSSDSTGVGLWDTGATPPSAVSRFGSELTDMTLSSDGRWALASKSDQTAELWDISREPFAQTKVYTNVQSAYFDGPTMVLRKSPGEQEIWNVATASPDLVFAGLPSSFNVSDNGQWAILFGGGYTDDTGSSGHRLAFIATVATLAKFVPPNGLLDSPTTYACNLVGHGLTRQDWHRLITDVAYRPTCVAG